MNGFGFVVVVVVVGTLGDDVEGSEVESDALRLRGMMTVFGYC